MNKIVRDDSVFSAKYDALLQAHDALAPFAAHYQRILREEDARPLKVLVPFDWLERAAYYYDRATRP